MNSTPVDKIDTLQAGSVVSGKYRIERELGGGCCGRVFCAHNVLLARDVAIKFLRDEHAADPEFVARFLREARATNHVRHPHVVDVLDVGLDGDVPYIVEELLVGEDLGKYLARKGGRLSARAALERMLPVIDGVAYAHSRGVVHRDLKPENVFLARTPDGIVPKVLDFGISKVAGPEAHMADGTFMGTPAFIAPEQIQRFGEADARADVWSLGVMLYELLAGRPPFRSSYTPALLAEICAGEPVALDDVAPDLSPELVAVVRRCMARDPSDRFPDAGALVVALRALDEAPTPRTGRLQTVAASIAPKAPRSSVPAVLPYDDAVDASFADDRSSLGPVIDGLTASRVPRRALFAVASIALGIAAFGFASRYAPHPSHRVAPPITSLQLATAPTPAPVAPVVVAAPPPPAARVERHPQRRPPSAAPVRAPTFTDEATPVVARAVDEHSDEITDCIERGEDEEGRGRVTVRVVISPTGNVLSARPSSPPALRDVGQCIAGEMYRWALVVPGATGNSTVTWPFDIDPDAQ